MEKAKQAISKVLSNSGKHKTDVEEDVRRPVTEEHIYPHQHEEVTTAIDREIHQHHHQTAIQPIKTTETLDTKHEARTVPVQTKTFDKLDTKDLQTKLAGDEAKYTDSSAMHDTNYTTSQAPAVVGEHVNHHIHQHVQPVIQKDVIQPRTVHTTVPIHEVHTSEAVHHETTILPAKTMEEFMKESGGMEPRTAKKLSEFDGCPTAKAKELKNDVKAQQAIHGL